MKDRIAQVRRLLGLTQKEFGFNLGCSRDKIANIELGRVVPDDVFVKHICVVYNVSETWIRYGTGEMWSLSAEESIRTQADAYASLPPLSRLLVDWVLNLPEEDQKQLDRLLSSLLPLLVSKGQE